MRIGILGAGQLGMMLAEAGKERGLTFRFLDPHPDAPARSLGEFVCAPFDDEEALLSFAHGLDVITYEFENVPAGSAELLQKHVPVFPHPRALSVAQDRLNEKTFFEELGINVPRFARIDSLEDLQFALQDIGFPAVLKTRREGYDGKGQIIIRSSFDTEAAWAQMKNHALILEQFVEFERELSIISVRNQKGETAFYPLMENVHYEGILRVSRAPATVSADLQKKAESYARLVMEKLDYVGVLTIELFQLGDQLMANEMAPRVHNSGHLTIEASETSQFENHLRAICGLPMGSTVMTKPSAMINFISTIPPKIASIKDVHLHLYGKEPKRGRKLGHVTIVASSNEAREAKIKEIQALL